MQAPAAPRLLRVAACPPPLTCRADAPGPAASRTGAAPVPVPARGAGVSPCDAPIVTRPAPPVTMEGRTVVVPAAAAGDVRRTV